MPAVVMPLPREPMSPAWVTLMSPPRVWARMPMSPPPSMVADELVVMVTVPLPRVWPWMPYRVSPWMALVSFTFTGPVP